MKAFRDFEGKFIEITWKDKDCENLWSLLTIVRALIETDQISLNLYSISTILNF